MCQSIAEGGARCAAHTRPKFEKALAAVVFATSPQTRATARAEGTPHVAAHASTPTGAIEVDDIRRAAEQVGNHDYAAWLTTCARIGASQRQAIEEVRRIFDTRHLTTA